MSVLFFFSSQLFARVHIGIQELGGPGAVGIVSGQPFVPVRRSATCMRVAQQTNTTSLVVCDWWPMWILYSMRLHPDGTNNKIASELSFRALLLADRTRVPVSFRSSHIISGIRPSCVFTTPILT